MHIGGWFGERVKAAGHGIDNAVHDLYLLDIGGWAMGATTGYNPRAEYMAQKTQRQALESQNRAYAEQSAEIARQKKRAIEQQKRENQQLMNSISNLTNTSYSGVSSPSIDYDKYGDLG